MKLSEDLRASAGAAKVCKGPRRVSSSKHSPDGGVCLQSVRLRDVTLDLKSFMKHIDSCLQLGGGLVVSVNASSAIWFLRFEIR